MSFNTEGNLPPVIFLMGPTASGKTDLAMALSDTFPSDIISVDSTLVYRGMDIGTAKPTEKELAQYPHGLVDICDPAEPYSAADFCQDAELAIARSVASGRIPILVGGTMMYFKALLDGLAKMPESIPSVRDAITCEAEELGWPAMHKQLQDIDPIYAEQLHPNHSQRISRALEVYRISGKTMTQHRAEQHSRDNESDRLFTNRYNVLQFALLPEDRSLLHRRIEKRFSLMLEQGLITEVEGLRERENLHLDLPSMRAVGYRQVWQYLNGDYNYATMVDKGVAATRQLAKRQLTWLRSWQDLTMLPISTNSVDKSVGENMNCSTLQKNVKYILNFLSTKSI